MKNKKQIKRVVCIRLSEEQHDEIKAKVEGSTLLDVSKFVRAAIEFALQHDMAAVINAAV